MKKTIHVIVFLLFAASVALCQPSGWQYKMPITVTENSGSTLINYQLALNINTQALISAGQMNGDGSDIRFKNDCAGSNLNFFVDSGINTASTLIWVQIDSLPANSSKTILMFYGNPSAPSASSLSVFNGPYSATDSVNITNPGGVGDSQRGFRFAPTEDIIVGSFGKNEPTGTTRYVTLFDFASQAVLRQIQVSGPIGIYMYAPLSNPIWLTQGTQYLLELFQGTNDGYYYATSSQIGQHMVYYDMRYCNGCTQNTFPTNVLGNYHYGLPDLWYYTKTNVTPAPTYSPGSVYTLEYAGKDTSICEGSQIQIGTTAPTGYPLNAYSWSPSASLSSTSASAPIASPLTTTTYIVTATDSAGCIITDSVTITVNTLPAVSFSLSTDTMCINNQPLVLSGGNPAGGNYSGTGVYSNTFYADSAGAGTHSITYTFTDSVGCSNNSADSIYVDICLGMDDFLAENYFQVYPNPATDELKIQSEKFKIESFEIFDLPGQCIFSQQLKANSQKPFVINISILKPGIYFLKVQTPSGTVAKKFVKE